MRWSLRPPPAGGPGQKARLIWDEWLAADPTPTSGLLPPPDRYLYAKIGSEKPGFEGTYRHHVMVEVYRGNQTPICQLLKHTSKKPTMKIFWGNQEWEAMCDRIPLQPNREPLTLLNGQPTHRECKECQSRAGRYILGFQTSKPVVVP